MQKNLLPAPREQQVPPQEVHISEDGLTTQNEALKALAFIIGNIFS